MNVLPGRLLVATPCSWAGKESQTCKAPGAKTNTSICTLWHVCACASQIWDAWNVKGVHPKVTDSMWLLIKVGGQLQKEGTGADVIWLCITYSTAPLTSEQCATLLFSVNMSDCVNPSQSCKASGKSLDVYLKHESKRRDVGKTCRIHTGARWCSVWSADRTFRAPRGNAWHPLSTHVLLGPGAAKINHTLFLRTAGFPFVCSSNSLPRCRWRTGKMGELLLLLSQKFPFWQNKLQC